MKDFRNLNVWRKAHELVISVYQATTSFPQQETYGLAIQLRSAASSVPANIAEGCGSNGSREFARFLEIALRSALETEYPLLLAKDLKYLKEELYRELDNKVTEVKRMLTRLLQKIRTDEETNV